jgi:hypothetical protein
MKYRKKSVVIEAVQWTGQNEDEVDAFLGGAEWKTTSPPCPCIKTPEGTMTASVGDWIIKGVKGEFYLCKPDIFEATYEAEAAQ